MLLCVWQALNPSFIHVTFTAIVPGAYPGMPKCALDWLQKLTHVPLAIAILLVELLQTDTHAHWITHRLTDADDHYTHATPIGVSNYLYSKLDDWHSIECKLTPDTQSSSICFCTLWPCDLDLWPLNPKTILGLLLGYLSLNTLRSFVWVLLRTNIHTHTPLNAFLPRLSSAWVINQLK